MGKVEIDKELCKACGICTAFCPRKLLYIGQETNSFGNVYAKQKSEEDCTACAMCGIMCPDRAIRVYK